MTTGQRISEKRKELGLSQESLGEKLGVSRQSIYKWESDTSLPDIDKLIALSRLFGVSVGWLLGVEEDTPSPATMEGCAQEDHEARQAQMMEEILRRYQAAQPKPQKSAWEKWSVRILAFTCGSLLVSIFIIRSQLNALSSKYNALNSAIEDISYQTNIDIDRMADRMTARLESVLKAQSELCVDYDCEIKDFDLLDGTITFALNVVPKTHVDGMTIYFQANSSGEIVESQARQVASQTFAGELTCPLTDAVSISVIFQDGDTRQMQLLNEYDLLYTDSLPQLSPRDTASAFGNELGEFLPSGTLQISEEYVYFPVGDDLSGYKTDLGYVTIVSVEVGLFHNRQLLQWLEPCRRPSHFEGSAPQANTSWDQYFHDGFTFFRSPPIEHFSAAEGDEFLFAARVTDEFGRITMIPTKGRCVVRNGNLLKLDKSSDAEYTVADNYTF